MKTVWGFSDSPQFIIELKRPLVKRTRCKKEYYVPVRDLNNGLIGAVSLVIGKRQNLARKELMFTSPTVNQGLDSIIDYFGNKR